MAVERGNLTTKFRAGFRQKTPVRCWRLTDSRNDLQGYAPKGIGIRHGLVFQQAKKRVRRLHHAGQFDFFDT